MTLFSLVQHQPIKVNRKEKAFVVVACMASAACSCMDQSTYPKINNVLNELKSWQDLYYTRNQFLSRSFVTVTFAQSIDGYMALSRDPDTSGDEKSRTSSNFSLSGDDSLLLTHALRSMHDGILVGGRTLSIDNPRLTNRLWVTPIAQDDAFSRQQPRPVVLDTNLLHFRSLGWSLKLKNPILCCSHSALMSLSRVNLPSDVSILPCLCSEDGFLDLNDVLKQLRSRFNIRTIMIEGGAATISSFFSAHFVDALVITIAPKLLHRGVAPKYIVGVKDRPVSDFVDLSLSRFITLGGDAVLVSRYINDASRQM